MAPDLIEGELVCKQGMGKPSLNATGCEVCPPGQMQLEERFTGYCHQCPKQAESCLADEVKMKPGFLAEKDGRLVVCPNSLACQGGIFPSNSSRCAIGYRGAGCAQCDCAEGFRLADSSVLSCVQCSKDLQDAAMQVGFWVGKSALLFALAAKSVLGNTGSSKPSGVYLNQLMSFATLEGTIMSAMLQTPAAQELQEGFAGVFFQASALVMEVTSGQTSSAAGTGQSLQCVLGYVGLESALWKGHLGFTVLAVLLTAVLSIFKGYQVGLVVGINCFWPEFMGHFGKYFVCYRLSPDSGLEWPQAPDFFGGLALVAACLLLCSAAVLHAWWTLYGTGTNDSGPKVAQEQLHVAFLTAPYQEAYAKFETERLLRKGCFTFLAAALPITASPALQLIFLAMAVLASLVTYALLLPYRKCRWNMVEVALLTASMLSILEVMALLTSTPRQGERYLTHEVTIIGTLMLSTAICIALTLLTIQNLLLEHSASTKIMEMKTN
ncbi:nst1 [Symbiodinium pilosum]|uniref:Nst1 protein n=1 Tax=Symbiodinium pilosum TaxID=2952 RepID=A0A812MHV5_SYMPI|nr:nst1 [Symbiodinium pilosum]